MFGGWQQKSAGAPQMLRGAFKPFNPLETSTGFLFAVILLEEHFWNRKRRKNMITQTLQSTVGVRKSAWTLTQWLAHAKSHRWQGECGAAFRNMEDEAVKDDQIQNEGGAEDLIARLDKQWDLHAGFLNKEPLPGYSIIVSHQWQKWMNEWMDVSGQHA